MGRYTCRITSTSSLLPRQPSTVNHHHHLSTPTATSRIHSALPDTRDPPSIHPPRPALKHLSQVSATPALDAALPAPRCPRFVECPPGPRASRPQHHRQPQSPSQSPTPSPPRRDPVASCLPAVVPPVTSLARAVERRGEHHARHVRYAGVDRRCRPHTQGRHAQC